MGFARVGGQWPTARIWQVWFHLSDEGVTVTGANVHDLDEITNLVRVDDQVVYADAGYQGVATRAEVSTMNTSHRSSGGSRPARAR